MNPDEACGWCEITMEAACNLYKGRFCELLEEYRTTGMTSEQAFERLYEITDPSQLEPIDREVSRLMRERSRS